jgi:hypothetical protein
MERLSPMRLTPKQLKGVGLAGAVSSVVEHYLDTVGVRGSKPLPRTILYLSGFSHFRGAMDQQILRGERVSLKFPAREAVTGELGPD